MLMSKVLRKSKLLIKLSFEARVLTLRVKLAFVKLRYVFMKAQILYHFDSKGHIYYEIDASGYTISGVLS